MRHFFSFLISLLNRGNIEKNKVVGSISKNSVTGDYSQLIDQSSNNQYTINQSLNTHETIYSNDYESKFKYSLFADTINSILKFIPLIFLIISLALFFLTKSIYHIYFLDIIFISSILFWSYKIPNKYRSFWVFILNCFFIIVNLTFLFTYKYFINAFIPTLTEYITVGIHIKILYKTFFLSSEYIIKTIILMISLYILLILSSNTINQWKIHVFGERDFPLTLKLMVEMILAVFIPFLVLLLILLCTQAFNILQSLV